MNKNKTGTTSPARKSGKNAARMWSLVSMDAALVGAKVAASLTDRAWHALVGGDPPTNPHEPSTPWGRAVAWAALSGALTGLSRMLGRHTAATGWQKVTGALPPGMSRRHTR